MTIILSEDGDFSYLDPSHPWNQRVFYGKYTVPSEMELLVFFNNREWKRARKWELDTIARANLWMFDKYIRF